MDIVVIAANHSSPEDSNNSHQNLPPPRLKPLLGHLFLLAGGQQTLTILKFIHPEDSCCELKTSTEGGLPKFTSNAIHHIQHSVEAQGVFVDPFNTE